MNTFERGADLPNTAPNSGRRKIFVWLLLLVLVLILAWWDGGEREVRPIEVEVALPEHLS